MCPGGIRKFTKESHRTEVPNKNKVPSLAATNYASDRWQHFQTGTCREMNLLGCRLNLVQEELEGEQNGHGPNLNLCCRAGNIANHNLLEEMEQGSTNGRWSNTPSLPNNSIPCWAHVRM